MYILSNGKKITEKMHERLCQAIKDDSKKFVYFLDVETGKLIKISRTRRQKLTAIQKKSQRFVPLPTVTKQERRERFRYFVEELGVIDVPELEERLREELKKGASINKLEQILKKDPSGWIHGWVQNEHDLLAEKIEEWIKSPPLNARDDPDYWYDDDCPICQLMRRMEEENRVPTLKETHEAFKKAKKQGAWVGGELFEKSKNKKKMSKDNRKFFLKWLPFNFCDRFCERCEEFRDECKLYQDNLRYKVQCQLEGKDPYDTKVVFEYLGQMMSQTIAELYQIMEKEGIKITKEEEERCKREQEMEEKKVKSHPLYRKCWALSADFRRFLEDFGKSFEERPWLLASLQNEIEEICFYCHLIAVKTTRALYSQIEEEKDRIKFPRPDSLVSGSLGFYSLITCQKSLESILNLMKDVEKNWVPKINQILELIEETKKEFKRTFPKVENYRDKIIFHGRFLN